MAKASLVRELEPEWSKERSPSCRAHNCLMSMTAKAIEVLRRYPAFFVPATFPLMLRVLVITALFLIAPYAWAANVATCILDKAPQVPNDQMAQAVYQACLKQYPGGILAVPQGSGHGPRGFKNGDECTVKMTINTWSNSATVMIGAACRRLYDKVSAG